jgi:hypothetical protein
LTPPGTLPLGDAPLFARAAQRTAATRLVLALALAGALAAAALVVSGGTAHAAAASSVAARTIVVLDLSGSISGEAYRRVGTLLTSLSRTPANGHRVGLVLFSDLAQEVLPPETKPVELLAYARYFRPTPARGRPGQARVLLDPYPDNPWESTFSRGTEISTGLALARRMIARDRLRSARVLLVSDLFDAATDTSRLKTQLLAYARLRKVELRVLPLPPYSTDTMTLLRRYLGQRHVRVAPSAAPRTAAAAPTGSFPLAFVAIVAALALALAANELLGATFRWREAPA